jgi:hypothetical protein
VRLHARAGGRAAARRGADAVIAGDIVDALAWSGDAQGER